ncbi:DUF3558 domain-containing protein [Actinocrispum sp. NPDC049592]|uniref:DUF3558 domain-containing protein n=1 Tax=Actinocrispum sp. NPDC049592 TaxID=3154835 RepID=UPI003422ACC6
MSRLATAAVVLAGLALAGCTETNAGEPVPASSAPAGGGAGPAPSVSIPPRPREIKLDGVDPCKLFTKAQLGQIKVTRQRNGVQTDETFKGAAQCLMDGNEGQTFFDYTVWLVTTEGMEPWLSGKRNADAKLVSVEGFPAASYKIRGTTTFNCWTSVGVANGQQLTVEFRPINRDVLSQNQMCEKSEQAAGLAMQTLQTLK